MFGTATTTSALVAWGSLLLFSASGTAPSFKMWYAELYPTRIRTTGQATVESIGGRLVGGVIWTFLFPVLIAATGLRTTMTIAGLLGILGIIVVMTFVPETCGRTVESLERRSGNGRPSAWRAESPPGRLLDALASEQRLPIIAA